VRFYCYGTQILCRDGTVSIAALSKAKVGNVACTANGRFDGMNRSMAEGRSMSARGRPQDPFKLEQGAMLRRIRWRQRAHFVSCCNV